MAAKGTPRICQDAIWPVWPTYVFQVCVMENMGVFSPRKTGGSRPSSLEPQRQGGSAT